MVDVVVEEDDRVDKLQVSMAQYEEDQVVWFMQQQDADRQDRWCRMLVPLHREPDTLSPKP